MPLDVGQAFMAPQLQMAQMGQIEAATTGRNIQSAQALTGMQDTQRMQQIMATLGGAPGTPVEVLERAGKRALQSGMLDQAEKAFSQAGLIQQRAAHALDYKAQADERQASATAKKLGSLAQYAGMFPDSEAGWNAVKAAFLGDNPDLSKQEAVVLQMPWQPGLAKRMQQAAMSARDRLVQQHYAATEDLAERKAEAQEDHWAVQEDLSRRRIEEKAKQDARKDKAGGKTGVHAAARPTTSDRLDAAAVLEDYLSEADLGAMPNTTRARFVLELSSRARELAQGGTPWDAALDQALDENKDRLSSEGRGIWGKKTAIVRPKGEKAPAGREAGGKINRPDVTEDVYERLKPGETYWFGGQMYRKGDSHE